MTLYVSQAAGRWKNQKVAAAWNAWRDQYLNIKAQEALLKKSMLRWQKQALSAAFQVNTYMYIYTRACAHTHANSQQQ